jgi:hypothetical protein
VDTTVGTIQRWATFPNEDNPLWQGQFVQAALTLAKLTKAVVGGLVVSQCLTLYNITPVIYLHLESVHQWYLRKHAKRAAVQAGTGPAAV